MIFSLFFSHKKNKSLSGSKQSVQMRRYSVLVMASMLLAVSGCAVSTEAG